MQVLHLVEKSRLITVAEVLRTWVKKSLVFSPPKSSSVFEGDKS
jgi:hypothetical protein